MNDSGQLHTPPPFFGKMPEKLLHDKTITDGAKVLYSHMHWRYGSNKTNFESRESIANYLGVSEQTISNRINELEAHGWIVVVMRDRKADGNYQTPYYHVFIRVKDAKIFRETYQPSPGEMMRPQPKVSERKTRKGVGGKPKHKEKETSPTQVYAVNLGLPHADNSSLRKLDSSYLDSVKDKEHEKPFSDSIAISIRLLNVFVLRVSIQRILEVLEKENPAPPPTIYTPVFNAVAKYIHNIPQPESVTGKAVGVIRSIEKEVKAQFTAVFGEYHEGVAAYTIERLSKSAKYVQKYAAPFAVQYLSFLQLNEAKIRDVLLNGLLVQVPVEPPPQPTEQSTPATDQQYEAYELALQKAGM